MKFLKDSKRDINAHFEGRQEPSDFLQAKQILEVDRAFLEGIETRMKEMAGSSGPMMKARADQVQELLQDVVNLRRSWMSLQEDKWMKDDMDMASFFNRPGKVDNDGSFVPPGRELPASSNRV